MHINSQLGEFIRPRIVLRCSELSGHGNRSSSRTKEKQLEKSEDTNTNFIRNKLNFSRGEFKLLCEAKVPDDALRMRKLNMPLLGADMCKFQFVFLHERSLFSYLSEFMYFRIV